MRTAIFGLGPMGKRQISAVKELGYEIVGLCDKSAEAAEKARQELDLAREIFFADAEKMLEQVKAELVIIATNSDSHEHLTLLSAEKGARYILCEKPMANSVRACASIIGECKKLGVKLAVNHPQRYMKRFSDLASMAYDPALGGPESITFISANAGLAMMGSHFLEMARIVLKEDVVKVSARLSKSICSNPRGKKFDDPCGIMIGETKTGKKVVIVLGNESGLGIRMIAACKYGMIDGDLISGTFHVSFRTLESRDLPPTRYGCSSSSKTVVLESESVVESAKAMILGLVRGDKDIESSPSDSMHIIKLLASAYFSSENGGVAVDVFAKTIPEERLFPWP
jgi:predicted dehydrogenase